MFFGFRLINVVLKIFLSFMGMGFLFRERLSEADRKKFKQKARLCRHKLNEALDVWDNDLEEEPTVE